MRIYNTFIIPILIQNLISLPIPNTNTKIKPLPYLVPDSTPKNKIGTHPPTNSPKTDAPNQFKDEKDLFHKQQPELYWRNAYNVPISYKLVKNEFMPEYLSERNNLKELRILIRKAFDLWASSGDIRFIEVGNEEDAEIRISFMPSDHRNLVNGPNNPPVEHCIFADGGLGGTLAHAYFPGTTKGYWADANRRTDKLYDPSSIAGDLHFDANEKWLYHLPDKENNEKGTYIFATAVHELGHSLGFDHVDDFESIMSPALNWKWNAEEAFLSNIDVYLIRSKYGDPRSWIKKYWIFCVFWGSLIVLIIIYKMMESKNVGLIRKNSMWKSMASRRSHRNFYDQNNNSIENQKLASINQKWNTNASCSNRSEHIYDAVCETDHEPSPALVKKKCVNTPPPVPKKVPTAKAKKPNFQDELNFKLVRY